MGLRGDEPAAERGCVPWLRAARALARVRDKVCFLGFLGFESPARFGALGLLGFRFSGRAPHAAPGAPDPCTRHSAPGTRRPAPRALWGFGALGFWAAFVQGVLYKKSLIRSTLWRCTPCESVAWAHECARAVFVAPDLAHVAHALWVVGELDDGDGSDL